MAICAAWLFATIGPAGATGPRSVRLARLPAVVRGDGGPLLLGTQRVEGRLVLVDLRLQGGLLRRDGVELLLRLDGELLRGGLRLGCRHVGDGGLLEDLALVAGDGLEGGDPPDELVGGVAGHEGAEGAHRLAGVGAPGDAAHLLLRRPEDGRGLGQLGRGGLRGGPLGGERRARLVELLGDDLQLVALGGDELRGLGRRGRRRLRRDAGEQDPQDHRGGDEDAARGGGTAGGRAGSSAGGSP